jgi:vacuolar-type H+-ATPase subunit I/STV1
LRYIEAKQGTEGKGMSFNYKWTTKEEGNYAIRKREARGREAGKEIEPKGRQTSETHFFIWADRNDYDTMRNIQKINEILKTITYEYVYKGTKNKSSTKYLTKTDIDDVIKNIEEYKGTTIPIEKTKPKKDRNEESKTHRRRLKEVKDYLDNTGGERNRIRLFELVAKRKEKEGELKEKIKQLKKELLQTEKDITKEIETIDKEIYKRSVGLLNKKPIPDKLIEIMIKAEGYKNLINRLYGTIKVDRAVEKAKEIQKKYREKENIKAGKPIRKVGRPKKET